MLASIAGRNPTRRAPGAVCYDLAVEPPSTFLDLSFRSAGPFTVRDKPAPTEAQQIVPQVQAPSENGGATLSPADPASAYPEKDDEIFSPIGWVIPSKKFKPGPEEDLVDSVAAGGSLLLTRLPLVAGIPGDGGDRSVPSIDEDCLVSQPSLSHLLKPQPAAAASGSPARCSRMLVSPAISERQCLYRNPDTVTTGSACCDCEESPEEEEAAEYNSCGSDSEQRQMWRLEAESADGKSENGAEAAQGDSVFSFYDGGMECGADCQSWRLDVDLTLQCTRGRLWGCSDVIGSIDFDDSGNYFATGGISRKIRVYSLSSLYSLKERKLEEWRERGARRSCDIVSGLPATVAVETAADSSVDSEFFNSGLSYAGSRRGKRRAASTSDLRWYAEASERGDDEEAAACVLDTDQSASKILCCAAKLSSVMWVPGSSGTVGAGDYDGVFAEWDIEKGLCVTEREEHEGQRIWSVDYSQWMGSNGKPMSVSASDNGAVCLWSADSEDSVAKIRLASGNRAICSAKFGPARGGENLLALAGADSKVYLYDLRNLEEPLLSLAGHQRTVSFVRFMGPGSLVSSSVDSTVKLWDVTGSNPSDGVSAATASPGRIPKASVSAASQAQASGSPTSRLNLQAAGDSTRLRASCNDHVNVRNFVGLSVTELDGGSSLCNGGNRCGKAASGSAGGSGGGLIATGSETNDLVIYHVDSQSRCSCALKFDFGFAKPPGNHGNSSRSSNPSGRSWSPTPGMTGRESSSGGQMGGSGSGGGGGGGNSFVSAVGWQQRAEGDLLGAANSQGVVRILRTRCE
ncbi:hypothetical protein CLOP_g24044 [Closterium sp. NIES-67]|nr:hypothetical protein CLOP_g24044 [Closterium sp. NIES-67]